MSEILTAVLHGLQALFSPHVFSFMMLGLLIGMFFGIVPGLGGLTGMGLLLPFAFGMEPYAAFAFLLGMVAVVTQTDTIPAVLIGVPGTAAAQATYLDGYPMAKRGEAGRALSASYLASVVGTIVAMIVFVVFLPVTRTALKSFSSPEYFTMALLGLFMVGLLSGTSMMRGIMVVGLGLLVSMVGYAPNTDYPRYIFDWQYLEGGIPLIPIALGLFAVPEVVDLMIRKGTIAEKVSSEGGIARGLQDCVEHWWLIVKCGVIGCICGMIPGLGALVAEWFGYGHAVQSAKDASMFGKGDVRGVIAPETATAGQKPGSLLPTVAFGIPGSGPMALLLGAFLIVGLRPGPEMLNQKLDLTFMMVWTIVIANIIAALISLFLQKYLVLLCYVRSTIIAPAIICFMAIGATLANKEFDDLLIFGVFGILGYIFKHADWPRVPLIIGLVLGYFTEVYLFISVDRYGASWLWKRPIVVIIEILILLSILIPALKKYLKKDDSGGGGTNPNSRIDREKALKSPAWWVGVFMAALASAAVIIANGFDDFGKIFPWAIGIPILILATLHTLLGLINGVQVEKEPTDGAAGMPLLFVRLKSFAWIAGLLLLMVLFGHHVGVPLYLVLFLVTHREKLWITGGLALALWAFVYFILDGLMHIHFPTPLLGGWMGI